MALPVLPDRRRMFHCIVLAAVACCYYATYYDLRVSMYDESFTLYISQRMFSGDIPYRDFDPTYGVLWFYPIVFFFKFFGATFNVMRIVLFGISCMTGILSFYIVDKITENRVLAYVAAVSIIMLHAPIYRVLIPFAVALSALVFTQCDFSQKHKIVPFGLSGFVTGVISLIRPEYSWPSACLLFIFALCSAASAKRTFSPYAFIRNVTFACLGIGLSYLPFLLLGAQYGFLGHFLREQSRFVVNCVSIVLASFFGDSGNLAGGALTGLPRLPFAAMTYSWNNFVLGAATYCAPALLAAAAVCALLAPREPSSGTALPAHIRQVGVILVALSPSFFTFFCYHPRMYQFFQLLPSMILLFAVVTGKWLRSRQDGGRPLARCGVRVLCLCGILMVFPAFVPSFNQVNLFLGPLALSHADDRLEIPPLVSSRMPAEEVERIGGMLTSLDRYTESEDIVAVYPYMPGIYALSRKKPFGRRLYYDDGILAREPDWCEKEVKRFEDAPPKAVVICNWPINGRESSRFANWAKPVYDHVVSRYRVVLSQEVNECRLYILK